MAFPNINFSVDRSFFKIQRNERAILGDISMKFAMSLSEKICEKIAKLDLEVISLENLSVLFQAEQIIQSIESEFRKDTPQWKIDLVTRIATKAKNYFSKAILPPLDEFETTEWFDLFRNNIETSLLQASGWTVIDLSQQETFSPIRKTASCYEFALWQAGIKKTVHNALYWNEKDLLDLLSMYEFQPVASPKPGDLVLFFNKEGQLVHMGIIHENGKILAKPGNARWFAYVHDLEETSSFYGDRVCYYRKSSSDQTSIPLSDEKT